VNIPADAGRGMGLFEELHGRATPGELADELKQMAGRNYGEPIREFVRRLVADRSAAGPVLKSCRATSRKWVPAGASGEVGRVAERFAIVAAAGEMASEWGITGWPKGEALAAAERCFYCWLRERGTAGGADVEAGVRVVRQFIELHGSSRFQVLQGLKPDTEHEQMIVNRAGFKRKRNGRTEYLFLRQVWENEILKGFNYKEVARELRERGHLFHESDRLTIKPGGLPDGVPSRVYAVRDSILDNDDAADADAA
jgi:putative DNA primase/helicase